MANVMLSALDKFYRWIEARPQYRRIIVIAALLAIMALGIYIRAIPALKWGLELHGNDPWIEYWQANYTYTHGPLAWYTLTPDNPDTRAFWYPWGRDFVHSSYPGLPIWTGTTYHIVKYTGLSLKDWVALQPLLFAALTVIAAFLAVREITDGSDVAGLLAALFYALVPAASDRTIVGFVEKEGIAFFFVFLFIYFYSKYVKAYERGADRRARIKYMVLTALTMAAVGWFWGGYLYILGSFVVYLVLYPFFMRGRLKLDFLYDNVVIVLLSMVFVTAAPKFLQTLGFYPPRPSVGLLYLVALIAPFIYYVLQEAAGNGRVPSAVKSIVKPLVRSLGVKGTYFTLLLVVGIAGIAAIAVGAVSFSPRYAWALGLRGIIKVPPIVESVEEHQPALVAHGLLGVLDTWGGALHPLFFASALALALLGIVYLLYIDRPDRLYLALAFAVAFYAYMNVTYFEAAAASFGILVASIFAWWVLKHFVPSPSELVRQKRGRVSFRQKNSYRVLFGIYFILAMVALAYSGYTLIDQHSRMIPSIMAGGAPIADRNDAWYDLIKFIKENTSKDALIVTWWDYGYWITVNTGRKTLADGATLNSTQISILGRILTAKNETEAIELLKKLHAPVNDTYILFYDVFYYVPGKIVSQITRQQFTQDYAMWPVNPCRLMVGLVDIPKSIWMIRIGGRNVGDYFYLYHDRVGAIRSLYGCSNLQYMVSPRFDDPNNLGLIYKLMVHGIWNIKGHSNTGNSYGFIWMTGDLQTNPVDNVFKQLQTSLGLKYMIEVNGIKVINPPTLKHFKPYYILVEPYYHHANLVVVIFLYKVVF